MNQMALGNGEEAARTRQIARVGMVCGWITVLGILLLEGVGPSIVAGPPVSGATDAATILAHYDHGILAPIAAATFLIILTYLAFAVALKRVLHDLGGTRFLAELGLVFGIAEAPVLMANAALVTTFVTIATGSGQGILPLFRFWDVLYNTGAYGLEAGWALCFALAARHVAAFPRWTPTLGYVVAALQLINMAGLWTPVPTSIAIVGNLALAVWFVVMSVGLGRVAKGGVDAAPASPEGDAPSATP